jgi:hypothetical protein
MAGVFTLLLCLTGRNYSVTLLSEANAFIEAGAGAHKRVVRRQSSHFVILGISLWPQMVHTVAIVNPAI